MNLGEVIQIEFIFVYSLLGWLEACLSRLFNHVQLLSLYEF